MASTSGNIRVVETDAVSVQELDNDTADDSNSATGIISLSAGDTITVATGGNGVDAIDGNVTLDANGATGDVAVQAAVQTTNTGGVTITAARSVSRHRGRYHHHHRRRQCLDHRRR